MANWFFYDRQGRKQGPFTDRQLRFFVLAKRIVPDTQMETDDGQAGLAGDIPGLFPVSGAAPFAGSGLSTPQPLNPGMSTLSGLRQADMPVIQPTGSGDVFQLAQPSGASSPQSPAPLDQRQSDIPAIYPSGSGGTYGLAQPPEAPVPPVVSSPVSAQQRGTTGIYCTGCGALLERDTVRCPNCGSDTAKNTRFCHQCGSGLNPGQVACPKCGASVFVSDNGLSF